MKILKISLSDYRCHTTLEKHFSRGINLLLGDNGAGKSSVLEAIGIALFDAETRTGSNTHGEAIQKGKRCARIVVDFEGVDGREYRVSRQLGDSSHHRLEGGGGLRLEGKKYVLEKLRELTGIPGNEKKIYQNVITAAQNRIVNAFLESNVKREESFNQIFNTEIY